jgi:glutamyl-tRNA synthetase
MNAQYIAKMDADELVARSAPFALPALPPPEVARAAVELHRTRVRTTIEMGRALSTYAADPEEYDADGMKKQVKPETPAQLRKLVDRLEGVADADWTPGPLEAALRASAEEQAISAGKLIHPTRLALTGVTVGAPLFDVMALVGRETAMRRMRSFLARIESPVTPP